MNFRRLNNILIGLLVCILVPSFVLAQPLPTGDIASLGSRAALSLPFKPSVLKGIKVYPQNPFKFDFLLDPGDAADETKLKEESTTLLKYFLAALTVPEKDLWVNLSPYEKDRIIPESFGLTGMGRDLLHQDYMLKQIAASIIYPEDELGKTYWKRVYEEAAKRFGTTNIPVNTFNKVWIIPQEAVVYENAQTNTAYIGKSKLKVLLEEDYLATTSNLRLPNELTNQITRELVIPQLEKEVNEGKNFAPLRQIYQSLILATWYKQKLKSSHLSQIYADKNKVGGIQIKDPQEKQKIYDRYIQAFRKGSYSYVKEDVDPLSQQIVLRRYFSGGASMAMVARVLKVMEVPSPLSWEGISNLRVVRAFFNIFNPQQTPNNEPPKYQLVRSPIDLKAVIPKEFENKRVQVVLIADNAGALAKSGAKGLNPRIMQGLITHFKHANNYLIINSDDSLKGLSNIHKPLMEKSVINESNRRYFFTLNSGTSIGSVGEHGQIIEEEKAPFWPLPMRIFIAKALTESFYDQVERLQKEGIIEEYYPNLTKEKLMKERARAIGEIDLKKSSGQWDVRKDGLNIVNHLLPELMGEDAFIHDAGSKLSLKFASEQTAPFLNSEFFKAVERMAKARLAFYPIQGNLFSFAGKGFVDVQAQGKVQALKRIIAKKIPPVTDDAVRLYVVLGDKESDLPALNEDFGEGKSNALTLSLFLDPDIEFAGSLGKNVLVSHKPHVEGALNALRWLNSISGRTADSIVNPLEASKWEIVDSADGKDKRSNTGGIDLRMESITIERPEGESIKISIDPSLNTGVKDIAGFEPVVTKIESILDLRAFLGLQGNH